MFVNMKIVLAYSGGLDTSVLMSWIKEKYNAEMIGFCADSGRRRNSTAWKRSHQDGASKISLITLQEIRARFHFPHAPCRAISRPILPWHLHRGPLIASAWSDRRKEKADAIAHGATGKGNGPGPLRAHRRRARGRLASHRPWRDERYRTNFPVARR